MPANLNYNTTTRKYSFASSKPAWHGVGQILNHVMTAEEALVESQLDFTVAKVPNFATYDSDGVVKRVLNPDSFSTVRLDTDQILGTVGKIYTVLQNKEAFAFFTDFVGESSAIFETAGAIYNGATTFISCKLPDIMVVGKKDNIEEYCLVVNDHSGKGKLALLFTPVRVVCNNTLNQALGRYRMKVEIKHSTNIKERLDQAGEILGIHKISMQNRSEIFNLLAKINITDQVAKDSIRITVLTKDELKLVAMNENRYERVDEISTKKKNILVEMEAYLYQGVGQEEIAGSAWWLYNGITGYYQNCKNYKTPASKFDAIMLGDVEKNVKNVMNNMCELIDLNLY